MVLGSSENIGSSGKLSNPSVHLVGRMGLVGLVGLVGAVEPVTR